MNRVLNLNNHFALTSTDKVAKLAKPLVEQFGVKHFRYLKLYRDKSRVLLSNYADCTRFLYEDGHFSKMWFDGESQEHLNQGWYLWALMSAQQQEKSGFEMEINHSLKLSQGITVVEPGLNYWEIFTFDSDSADIYSVDRQIFTHFMYYFKEQARSLITRGEKERLQVVTDCPEIIAPKDTEKEQVTNFLVNTRINRYYLGGKYQGVYLTAKEAQCIYWLIQGKTAEEIALIEGNSLRTIECHVYNMRKKLNCYKQTQLVKIVLESGILKSAAFTQ